MKMQIFGSTPEQAMRMIGGGYDLKTGRAVLVIQDENNRAGLITFDVTEAREAATTLTRDLPPVSVVVAEISKQVSGPAAGL